MICLMGSDDIPHWCSKSFSLMGEVKSCLLIKCLGIALLNKRKKAETSYFFHTRNFSYLDCFTGKVLFLGHDLIFAVFHYILIDFVQKLGRRSQIHTTGIFYGQKPVFFHWEL